MRLARYLVLAITLAILILSLLYFWKNTQNPVSAFLHDVEVGTNHTNLWKEATGVGGLDLMIESALDETWARYFEEYVGRWNAGYDAVVPLSLRIEHVPFDPLCKPSLGKLKVCNGNYGDTGWRGINIAVTDSNNLIQHSVIQVNDYYTDDNMSGNPWKVIKYSDFWGQQHDESQWKYTMCHELGHGFGLPHSDENMWNRNTGECMDYTRFPRRNLSPGQHNFDLLHELYGSIEDGKRRTDVRHRKLPKRFLSKQTMKENELRIRSALEDPSCFQCQIPLPDGFQATINKLPVLFAPDSESTISLKKARKRKSRFPA